MKHTHTHHTRYDFPGRGIGQSQIPLPAKHTKPTTDRHPCPQAGFEPAIPASERSQTHALDCAATGISDTPS